MARHDGIHRERRRYSKFERFLRIFADVEPREGLTCVILVSNIFLILIAYYMIKPVREGWLAVSVVGGLSQLEVKSYSAFAQSLLLVAILPAYARLAAAWTRRALIMRVGIAFAALLILFWLTQPGMLISRIPYAGIAFYLFVGIFSVTLVAQFWSFTSDIYGLERGRRLFPLVAVGAALGAVVGSWIGEWLIRLSLFEAFDLMLVALIPLGAALLLVAWTDRRGTYGSPSDWTTSRWKEPAAPLNEGPFSLIFRHQYLTATAMMILVFSWIVASGDNILFAIVQESLSEQLAAYRNDPAVFERMLKDATTAFYSDLYFWVNLVGLLLQAFIVSRILRFGGMQALLLTTPVISLAAYASMAFAPILGLVKFMKVAENSSAYSINNTARHMLWLPTTKEMLYQAKPTVDTLFVRLGDGLAAVTILIGTRVVPLDNAAFLGINVVLVLVWIGLTLFLIREHRRWVRDRAVNPLPRPVEAF